ncbi:hypothetical protein B0H10DRAFT_2121512 [Mycena sp. CBHHK59/15]|nr:hypothetical protein B0H10DRAFT_2121512 [Mycena sp. CBHHK59/15]
MKGSDAQPKDGSIHAVFARPDERPAVPSDRTLTPAELRAHIVRWVAENNRPLAIVEDREFKTILGAGRPEFNLPGRRTVSRDLNVSFGVSRAFIEELLKTIWAGDSLQIKIQRFGAIPLLLRQHIASIW